MSLTNPNKVVTEERLNEYHNTILPYLGGMPDILANKFSRADLYSTDEKMIGRWIDGKPLYQRTFTIDNPSNNARNQVSGVNFLTTETLCKLDFIGYINSIPMSDYYYKGNLIDYFNVTPGGDGTSFYVTYDFRGDTITKIIVTVQYTKTIDSSVEIGLDTDYSTTEKIVGTWIDGKPLYQKTVSCGALPNNTTKQVAHNIANLASVISVSGNARRSSDNTNIFFPDQPMFDCYVKGSDVYIATNADKSSYTQSYVTLQYTKTTD